VGPRHPFGICFDGANIWVTNNTKNDVIKLSASDGSIMGTYEVAFNPMGICFDAAHIWVANSRYNNVSRL